MTTTNCDFVEEPARRIPVSLEADLCVIGGSCTGVFAAIQAARLGLRVALIEKAGAFGGTATLSLVCAWHSPLNSRFDSQIIGGLTLEVMNRLKRRDAVAEIANNPSFAWQFNPCELMIELDELIREHRRITPLLHTAFVAPWLDSAGVLAGVIIENKSGRSLIRARTFIDASGDADLCHRLGLATYHGNHLQPATTCATFSDYPGKLDLGKLLLEHGEEFGLPQGFAWGCPIPASEIYMLAGTRVRDTDCSDAVALTRAEMEGRRQVRAIQDLLRKYAPPGSTPVLQNLPSRLGIRQTRHVRCHYQITGQDVLTGRRFLDAIANGSYRVDVHHHDKPGITLKYLDGVQEYSCPGHPKEVTRWRDPLPADQEPTFYQIPFRSLLPQGPHKNLLAAGKIIDADPEAHAAIRVMVNMNQTGEAAGVAAWLSLDSNYPFPDLNPETLRQTLARQGAIIL